MNKIGRILALTSFALGTAGVASATTMGFDQTVDFGTPAGVTYLEVAASAVFTYPITVLFNPAADGVDWAKLEVTHKKNRNNPNNEIWLMSDAGTSPVFVGHLGYSQTGWTTDSFPLPSTLFAGVSGVSWTLALHLDETSTNGSQNDSIWLDSSRLYGEYHFTEVTTPPPPTIDAEPVASTVPEPGTMVLLGTGLLGVARATRRRSPTA